MTISTWCQIVENVSKREILWVSVFVWNFNKITQFHTFWHFCVTCVSLKNQNRAHSHRFFWLWDCVHHKISCFPCVVFASNIHNFVCFCCEKCEIFVLLVSFKKFQQNHTKTRKVTLFDVLCSCCALCDLKTRVLFCVKNVQFCVFLLWNTWNFVILVSFKKFQQNHSISHFLTLL